MAAKVKVVLPEDVAPNFKYIGVGHVKFILPKHLGGITVNVESIKPEVAERIVDHVPFLARKSKPKAKK